ncbi:hypothetical protein AALO_G00205640, partial [Alosa alosa]
MHPREMTSINHAVGRARRDFIRSTTELGHRSSSPPLCLCFCCCLPMPCHTNDNKIAALDTSRRLGNDQRATHLPVHCTRFIGEQAVLK